MKAARERRVIVGELALAGEPVEARTPAEALRSAAQDADTVVQRVKRQISTGEDLNPQLLVVLGEWLDRVSRISKTVIESKVDEVIADQATRVIEDEVGQVLTVLYEVLVACRLSPEQHQQAMAAMSPAFQAAGEGRRRSPQELQAMPTHAPPARGFRPADPVEADGEDEPLPALDPPRPAPGAEQPPRSPFRPARSLRPVQ